MNEAVLDTNIFISALTGSKNCQKILELLIEGRLTIAVSEKLLRELSAVLSDKKFEMDPSEAVTFVEFVATRARVVVPAAAVADCRDPKDNAILECALEANAACVITGDSDLLILNPWRSIKIARPAEFLKSIGI